MPWCGAAVKSNPLQAAAGSRQAPYNDCGDADGASLRAPWERRVRAPGDKSISHRALILGALASGETRIEGLLEGDDVLRTAQAMRLRSAPTVTRHGGGRWTVEARARFVEPAEIIDCGNSGTGVRLMMGAAAGYELQANFTGDASLQKRPMGRVLEPLSA